MAWLRCLSSEVVSTQHSVHPSFDDCRVAIQRDDTYAVNLYIDYGTSIDIAKYPLTGNILSFNPRSVAAVTPTSAVTITLKRPQASVRLKLADVEDARELIQDCMNIGAAISDESMARLAENFPLHVPRDPNPHESLYIRSGAGPTPLPPSPTQPAPPLPTATPTTQRPKVVSAMQGSNGKTRTLPQTPTVRPDLARDARDGELALRPVSGVKAGTTLSSLLNTPISTAQFYGAENTPGSGEAAMLRAQSIRFRTTMPSMARPAYPPYARHSSLFGLPRRPNPWSGSGHLGSSRLGMRLPSLFGMAPSAPLFEGDRSVLEGFRNIGNTCYMNAVLQALTNLEPFTQDLLDAAASASATAPNDGVFRMLVDLLQRKANQAVVNPRELKEAISRSAGKFAGSRQEDAHEFLTECLDLLNTETTPRAAPAAPTLATVPENTTTPRAGGPEAPAPVRTNFNCVIEHELVCPSCQHTSTHSEDYQDFSLDLPVVAPAMPLSLDDLLAHYFSEEQVEYTCSECGAASAGTRLCHVIKRLPRIVVLHIKRFAVDMAAREIRKRHDAIFFPNVLDLSAYCADHVEAPPPPPVAKAGPTLPPTPATRPRVPNRNDPVDLTGDEFGEPDKENSPVPKRRRLLDGSTAAAAGPPSTPPDRRHTAPPSPPRPLALPDLADEDAQLEWAMAESMKAHAATAPRPDGDSSSSGGGGVANVGGSGAKADLFVFGGNAHEEEEDDDLKRALALSLAETQSWDGWQAPPPDMIDTDAATTGPAARVTPPKASTETVGLLSPPAVFPTPGSATSPALVARPTNPNARYTLAAVVSHRGASIHQGHYICNVLDRKSQLWKCYDDDLMTEVGSFSRLRASQETRGYLFFYVHLP